MSTPSCGRVLAQSMPALNTPAPNFSRMDSNGQRRELKEFQGHTVLLCFFCGCEPCHRFARTWGQVQRSGTAAGTTTIIVFDGDKDALAGFSAETNIDYRQTALFPDPMAEVARQYDALPCPRLFVLDGRGTVKYVNNHSDDDPQKAPTATLVSKAVSAIESLTAKNSDSAGDPVLRIETATPTIPYSFVHDFGKVDRVTTPKLEQTIRLKNFTSDAIVIEKLQTTCACVGSVFPPTVQESGNLIPPGGGIDVRVSLDLRGLRQGKVDKQVLVYAKGRPAAIASLDLKLIIEPTAEFSVSQLDFGRMPAGASRSMTVTATIDRRLGANGWPRLICSHPDVQVTPGNPVFQSGESKARCMYTVTVPPNTRIGSLNGSLGFASGTPRGSKHEPDETAFLGGNSVAVLGEVTGPLSASPSAIVFGTLSAGLEANKSVVIMGENAQALEGLTVSTSSVNLLTHLGAPESAPTASNPNTFALALTVRLLKSRPLGALETEVMLTTPKGVRLAIPIIAYTPAGGILALVR